MSANRNCPPHRWLLSALSGLSRTAANGKAKSVKTRTHVAVAGVLLFAIGAQASAFTVVVTEQKTAKVSDFVADTGAKRVELSTRRGSPLPETQSFSIQDRHLIYGSHPITAADDLLSQGRSGALDIAVVREEYNSFSNPFRIMAALAGHPIQVSKIKLIAAGEGRLVWEQELVREPSSYQWSALLEQ